ncbi:MAG: hypothetical protein U0610_26675 [bacterium]
MRRKSAAHRDRPALAAVRDPRQLATVHREGDAVGIVIGEHVAEAAVEQRLEVALQRGLEVARLEERRERILELERYGRPPLGDQPQRRQPAPRRLVARSEVPRRGDVLARASCFRDDLVAEQQAELDADSGEADALATSLGARGEIVEVTQVAPHHARAVVDHRERGPRGIGQEGDVRGTGVERVGDDLGEDRFLERAGIGIAQVLEQVQQVDSGLTHDGLVSSPSRRALLRRRRRRGWGRR